MDYFKLLQLKKEPFSNSPDPDFFYHSKQHEACVQKLELAVRLRRGLNVIIGDIGTGKTTLCREMIRRFDDDADIRTHLILDPSFASATECLKQLFTIFCKETSEIPATDMALKEAIKQHLFSEGIDHKRTTVLVIDEGQKITTEGIEILRELLNYETNSFKLLQIVIFAQPEIEDILRAHANFADRINLLHYLAPMNFGDTRGMIHHRLKLSSQTPKPRTIFTLPALWAIYRFSKGYPRKIVHLCHQSVLTMIIQNRSKAGWAMIRSCKNRLRPQRQWLRRSLLYGGAALLIVLAAAAAVGPYRDIFQFEKARTSIFKVPAETLPVEAVSEPAPIAVAAAVAVSSPPEPPAQADARQAGVDASLGEASGAMPPPPAAETAIGEPARPVAGAALDEPAATALPVTPPDPPVLLGQIKVKPGDTLFKMVSHIYGIASNRNMRAVIEANPHIRDPNAIDLGDVIAFPAVRHRLDPSKGTCYWIVADEQLHLDAAFQRLYASNASRPRQMRLIAYWQPYQGLHFWLAARKYFQTAEAAAAYLGSLPSELAAGSRIESQLPEGATLFSYPY